MTSGLLSSGNEGRVRDIVLSAPVHAIKSTPLDVRVLCESQDLSLTTSSLSEPENHFVSIVVYSGFSLPRFHGLNKKVKCAGKCCFPYDMLRGFVMPVG